ncbi:MAG: 16S rRNA (guanine(527)-N(7))-methyltransferase RsmG [Solirubrobacterales bacterium]|nr:16S rRNA (guanine(527)-N(7))-methyltransferase RsmG [Solirubrobacterales bacterium]
MPAVDDRLRELAAAWDLPSTAPAPLATVLRLVVEEPTSITTVRDPAEAVDVHVADSLAGLAVPGVRTAGVLADLGAGGGFPGLALAAALPEARVVLVESVGKKCAFLRRAAAEAALTRVEVVHARAEEWAAGLGACDVVTARALAPLSVLAEYAAPLLRLGGQLVAWKGRRDGEEEAAGAAAAAFLGLGPAEVLEVRPFPAAEARHLHLYSKVRDTPPGYPRRPGMARKRPLGA